MSEPLSGQRQALSASLWGELRSSLYAPHPDWGKAWSLLQRLIEAYPEEAASAQRLFFAVLGDTSNPEAALNELVVAARDGWPERSVSARWCCVDGPRPHTGHERWELEIDGLLLRVSGERSLWHWFVGQVDVDPDWMLASGVCEGPSLDARRACEAALRQNVLRLMRQLSS